MSSTELANGYTRPVQPEAFLDPILYELVPAHTALWVNHKLNIIMCSTSSYETAVQIEIFVQIYIKSQDEKRGSWTSAKQVISSDAA